MLAVGVGKNVDKKELKTIAMNDDKHVFRVAKYKDLVKIIDALLKESCHQGKFSSFSLLLVIKKWSNC